MKIITKRLSVYALCFFIAYFPVRKVQAGLPLIPVAIEIIGGVLVSEAINRVAVPALCGKSPWGANDPVFACEASNTKKGFADKAKKSAKMAAIIAAAGIAVSGSNFIKDSASSSTDFRCQYNTRGGLLGTNISSISDCLLVAQSVAHMVGAASYSSDSLGFIGGFHRYQVKAFNASGSQIAAQNVFIKTDQQPMTDDEFNDDFWQTSPQIPPSTWSPEPTPENPNPTHPDPEWFPDLTPQTAPVYPSPNYPNPLPDNHPDALPPATPSPEHNPEDYPTKDPNHWPQHWPSPEELPDNSPGQFPGVWPMPGTTPVFPPETNPNPEPNPKPDPDTGSPTVPIPELPVPLPVIGPLTRTELETVLNKQYQDATNNLNSPDLKNYQDTVTNAMNDFITNKVTADIPTFGFNPFGFVTFGDGTCVGFSQTLSIGGHEKSVMFDAHCPPYDDYVRPTLMWKLYLLTGLYLYMLFTRTVRSI
ncbi:hypothetical protein [Photobacterium angustum]|uniref:hypothetical protein n=1 Tax=Photobacterium angustum TaxID=661 RepID=UPI0005E7D047|nr:hypothetical protein [Photobacterium angustum]KJF95128.1 hypothetical protein UB39_07100 [Photobacterium angustum]PSW81190.1 hypothetical protein CTN03_08760 [Photobacterium angustum]